MVSVGVVPFLCRKLEYRGQGEILSFNDAYAERVRHCESSCFREATEAWLAFNAFVFGNSVAT